jgi:D-glycero-D-manno-heptose 1,7-bisphosphate phosphatase
MPSDSRSKAATAVFLDRDGVLVRDRRHGADPAALEILAGVPEALRVLEAHGYRLVVASNQSGAARGLFTLGEAHQAAQSLAARLAARGVHLAGYYFCPHYPGGAVAHLAGPCDCRKPEPGLLLRAARDLDLDLSRSWFVGDTLADVEAARRAGTRPILVDVGSQHLAPGAAPPPRIARNLPQAVQIILAADGMAPGRVEPLPPRVLYRPDLAPDRRVTGEPSPWPNDAWAARARQDAAALTEVTASGPR